MTSILSIGQTALSAAQAGLSTTSHNIANAATPGYSRQSIVQAAAPAELSGGGYVGRGTVVVNVVRSYSDLLSNQVQASQSAQTALGSSYAAASRLDNLIADASAGVAPAVQDFFKSIQNVTTDPNAASTRQGLLSSAEALSARFHGLNDQIVDARNNINSEVTSSVGVINQYAKQISDLNDAISKVTGTGQSPNDLLDQRDQLVLDLSKEIKVNVVKDGGSGYNVFIGTGQPLVVGAKTYQLTPVASSTDASRLEVGYIGSNGVTTEISEKSISGGKLGGLFEFRATVLDPSQNNLGRIATVLGAAMNDQNRLGIDQNGQPGGDLFKIATPVITAAASNTSTAKAAATIVSPIDLTTSDYRLQYDGTNYQVTRQSDGKQTTLSGIPQTVDGISFGIQSGTPAAGDYFLIQPTINGAENLSVAVTDPKLVAAGTPIKTEAPVGNTGSGSISPGSIDNTYLATPLTSPITLAFTAGGSPGTGTISGFPDGSTIAYSSGTDITYKGMKFAISGVPANGDKFKISANTDGSGDARNVVALAAIQSKNTVGGTASIAGSYAQLVSFIGNKTKELEVTKGAADKILERAVSAQQSESGVNLDEEASNLMKYQQAYMAASKVMATAGKLFDALLALG